MTYQLGKLPARRDSRDIRLKAITRRGVTLKRAPVGYGHWPAVTKLGLSWGMLGNDRYGDCVLAEAGHTTMIWNAVQGRPTPFSTAGVLADYGAVTGFDPATGANDNGTDMRAAMSYRRQTGVADAAGVRHRLGAYVSVPANDWTRLMEALYAFEAVAIGFRVPESAMTQFEQGKAWSYVGDTNIVGGHDVPVVGRPSLNGLDTITWGQRQKMTRRFYEEYNDETWALLSPEMLSGQGRSPEGLDLDGLNALLAGL